MLRTKNTLQTPIESLTNKIICGDALAILKTLPSESIDCVVTSPPYWALRDYGIKGQIGLENDFEIFLNKLIAVFDQIKRVLKPAGTCWVNFGDTYSHAVKGGQKNNAPHELFDHFTDHAAIPKLKTSLPVPAKSLCLIPARFALRMIERGWVLRNEIIWHKTNAMPQSVTDRFTVDFEKIFFFVKQKQYYFEKQYEPVTNPAELNRRFSNPFERRTYRSWARKKYQSTETIKQTQARILQTGRNKRAVWSIATGSLGDKHYAVFPEKLIETPIRAGCPEGGIVLDPFVGSGTTALVAKRLNRNYIGIELNPAYVKLARNRITSIDNNAKETEKQRRQTNSGKQITKN